MQQADQWFQQGFFLAPIAALFCYSIYAFIAKLAQFTKLNMPSPMFLAQLEHKIDRKSMKEHLNILPQENSPVVSVMQAAFRATERPGGMSSAGGIELARMETDRALAAEHFILSRKQKGLKAVAVLAVLWGVLGLCWQGWYAQMQGAEILPQALLPLIAGLATSIVAYSVSAYSESKVTRLYHTMEEVAARVLTLPLEEGAGKLRLVYNPEHDAATA